MERDPATRSEQPIQETLFNFDEHDTVREGFLSRGRVTRFRKSQRPSCPSLRFSTISPSLRPTSIPNFSKINRYILYRLERSYRKICKSRETIDRFETTDRAERSLEGERLNAASLSPPPSLPPRGPCVEPVPL